jgi:hypothetical protein
MTQLDSYAHEGGSVSTVISVLPASVVGIKFGALSMMVTPSSVNWHDNCTVNCVLEKLDWLVI